MPTLTLESIHRIAYRLLCAAGALDGHAETVARHLAARTASYAYLST